MALPACWEEEEEAEEEEERVELTEHRLQFYITLVWQMYRLRSTGLILTKHDSNFRTQSEHVEGRCRHNAEENEHR